MGLCHQGIKGGMDFVLGDYVIKCFKCRFCPYHTKWRNVIFLTNIPKKDLHKLGLSWAKLGLSWAKLDGCWIY